MFAIKGAEHLVLRHRNHLVVDDRALRRAAQQGAMRRLRNGAYVPTAVWDGLSRIERARLEIAAAAQMQPGFVASHRSAAALWGIPSIEDHDGLVHARATVAAGTRTEHGIRKHAVHDLDLHATSAFGIPCVGLARTVLDIAATEDFEEAVVAADWARRNRVTEAQLRTALDEWGPAHGRRRIERAIDFADARSGSAGESLSRAQMAAAGLVLPELQQEFADRDGVIGYVDFWWPMQNRIGEFDGLMKYKEAEFRAGRTAGEVVSDEKIREDRLRATRTSPAISRWIYDALRRRTLVPQLLAAGIPRAR